MGNTFNKDPQDEVDFQIDWAGTTPVLQAGETISASTWTVPAGITEMNDANHPTGNTADTATIWLSGGTLGQTYTVTNRITTNQFRKYERSIHVIVKNQ